MFVHACMHASVCDVPLYHCSVNTAESVLRPVTITVYDLWRRYMRGGRLLDNNNNNMMQPICQLIISYGHQVCDSMQATCLLYIIHSLVLSSQLEGSGTHSMGR